jgi:hypothetical protein
MRTVLRRLLGRPLTYPLLIVAFGCGEAHKPAEKHDTCKVDSNMESNVQLHMSVYGARPIGSPSNVNYVPTYGIDWKCIGKGNDGYREVLSRIRTLPKGSMITLHCTSRLVEPEVGKEATFAGAIKGGGHPFLQPVALCKELKRIVSERQYVVDFDPPLDPKELDLWQSLDSTGASSQN